MSASDTPLTDREAYFVNKGGYTGHALVYADFARTLERRLQRANALLRKMYSGVVWDSVDAEIRAHLKECDGR